MNKFSVIIASLTTLVVVLMLRSLVYDTAQRTNIRGREAQREWKSTKTRPKLTILYHQKRPFYSSQGSEVKGLVASTINHSMKEIGIPFSWVETPATRQLGIVGENKSKVCALGWFKTPEREKFAKYSIALYQDKPFVAVTRADNELMQSEDNVVRVFEEYRLKLLLKRGYSYGTFLDQKIKTISPRRTVTTADNLRMLQMIQTHRADYCLMTEEEAYDLLVYSRLQRSNFKITRFSNTPPGNKRYLLCSQKVTDKEMDKINSGIRFVLTPDQVQ